MRRYQTDHVNGPDLETVYKRVCELPSSCGCREPVPETLVEAVGYSDSYAAVRKCKSCGGVYGVFVEG
jgi:hypothetical protein